MGCVDFTRLRWLSQIWVFEGSLSITSSIPFAGSGTTGHAVLQLNASSGRRHLESRDGEENVIAPSTSRSCIPPPQTLRSSRH